jgi:hypothetical protein
VNEPPESAPSAGRILELVDRFFPIVWIGLYVLLPVTGSGAEALISSFDQARDLEALRSMLAGDPAAAITENLIGPAYIATAAAVHYVARLTPEDSLIALTRVSYVLSVALSMVLVRVLVRRLAFAPASVSLAAQFAFMSLVFAAGTWHWSDIPWSHFYAAFLGVAFYALRFAPARLTLVGSGLVGVVLALLALTRSFEFLAVVAAWGIAQVILVGLRLRGGSRLRPPGFAIGATALVVTAAAVYASTGKRNSFLLYSSSGGEIYGDLLPAEATDLPTFDLALLPLKFVQLFLDPCFYSLCELHDYAGIRAAWRQPLVIQLPALAILPLCVLAVAVLVVWYSRHSERAVSRVRELRLLVEMTTAASGLTIGYLASTWSSSSALRFGFARDFLFPSLLSGVVAISLAFVGLYVAVARRGEVRLPVTRVRLSPSGASGAAAVVGALVLMVCVVASRQYGLPRLSGHHLGTLEYTARCGESACTVRINALTPSERPISIPRASLLTFGCGSDEPRFTLRVQDPSEEFPIARGCDRPRLVAAWPTVMGVPPNSSVLRVVEVTNMAGP